jgi:Methylamine utilisation protein MauE
VNAALLPLYLAAAGLLAASAAAKLRDPGPAADALVELRLPATRFLVRAVALVELAAAVLMVARPAPGATAACGLYFGFAALVLVQLVRGSVRSCGCLGSAALPPTRLHLALNVALAGCCAFVRPDVLGAFRHPFGAAVVLIGAATTAWALAAGLELIPQTLHAYRRPVA